MLDNYTVKTPASQDPVSLVDAKNFLRVDTTADDTLITSLISAATSQGEKFTGRVFEQVTFTGFFSGLSFSQFEAGPYLQIRRGPLDSVISFKSVENGSLVAVESTDYEVRETSGLSRIVFIETPPSADRVIYPFQVEFVAGYSVVPDDIKTAIKSHVLFMYENRGDVTPDGKVGLPFEVKAIYSRYRIVNTFG